MVGGILGFPALQSWWMIHFRCVNLVSDLLKIDLWVISGRLLRQLQQLELCLCAMPFLSSFALEYIRNQAQIL